MELALYAQGNTTVLDDDGRPREVSMSNHFCIERKVHVAQIVHWDHTARISRKWGRPQQCDGSCRNWWQRQLEMPEEIEAACQTFLATKD